MTVSREEIAKRIEAYVERYSGDWASATLTFSWVDVDVILAALRAAAELDHRTSGELLRKACLKAICDIGDRCSCADQNYQWRNRGCDTAIAHVDLLMAGPLASSLPDHQSADWRAATEASKNAAEKVSKDARVDPADLQKIYRANQSAVSRWIRCSECGAEWSETGDGEIHQHTCSKSQSAASHSQECEYCKEKHDSRVACQAYVEYRASQAGSEASSEAVKPVVTGIEAADELADYLKLRGIGDEGDAANIIHMLYERGFRPAPEQAAQRDVAETAAEREIPAICGYCARRVFEPCQSLAQAQNACTLSSTHRGTEA